MIEELTSFEIKKIFGDDLKPSTYKMLYDLILDLQKQFNKLGIDNEAFKTQLKLIISDKVKLELENLLENGELETIINNNLDLKISQVTKIRKFRPTLGFSPWFLDNSIEYLKNDVKNCVNAGIDNIVLALHIASNNNNELYLQEDITTVKRITKEYKDNNIKIKMLKLHCKEVPSSFKNTDDFNSKYVNYIRTLCNEFNEFGIEYLIVLNEEEGIYNNPDKQTFILNCIDAGQELGFKTGITATNFYYMYTAVTDTVKNKCDVLGVNYYQTISNKEDKTTFEDSLNAWKNGLAEFNIKTLKQKYNKEIIITETGVQDNWCALINPAYSNWSEIKKSNFKAVELYLYGMLETLKNCDELSGVYIWYSINNSAVINLLSSYMKGVK